MTPQDTQAGGRRATQGHRYSWKGRDVLAMESGCGLVRVRSFPRHEWDGLGRPHYAYAAELTAQPMAYFHGEVPRG